MWKEIWKNKAQNKNVSRADMVARAILLATNIENLVDLLNKAFTPGTKKYHEPYYALTLAANELLSEITYRKTILGSIELYNETDIDTFKSNLRFCKL